MSLYYSLFPYFFIAVNILYFEFFLYPVDWRNFGAKKIHKPHAYFHKLKHMKIFIMKYSINTMFFSVHAKYQWHMYCIMILLRYLKALKDGLLDPRGSLANEVPCHDIEKTNQCWLPFTYKMVSIYTSKNVTNHKYNCFSKTNIHKHT